MTLGGRSLSCSWVLRTRATCARWRPASVLLTALLAGCLTAEPAPGGSCATCHGDPTGEGQAAIAPPVALGGSTDPALVGAHQIHLLGGSLGVVVACAECHVVPARLEDPGHIDSTWPAEVPWGDFAKTGGATLPWDHATGTCTVYCHGASLAGGLATPPSWSGTGPLDCDACHGFPPPAPHPASDTCDVCHGPFTVEAHLNGEVTFAGDTTDTETPPIDTAPPTTTDTGPTTTIPPGCDACHGANGNSAPPPDLAGNTATTERGVGAHDAHILGTGLSAVVTCETCHVVPGEIADAGHIDGGLADVIFTGRATAGGLTPVYDDAALTCSNTWCHGGGVGGGTLTEPVWTTVDGTAATCGACHGAPPGGSHPPAPNFCDGCHENAAPGFTFYDPTLHINGSVELDVP